MNNIVKKETNVMKACQIDYRKSESYFLFPEKDSFGFTVDVNFNEKEDKALARIFLQELPTTQRNVQNVPAIAYHDKERNEQ